MLRLVVLIDCLVVVCDLDLCVLLVVLVVVIVVPLNAILSSLFLESQL